jgi:hypothetical protein
MAALEASLAEVRSGSSDEVTATKRAPAAPRKRAAKTAKASPATKKPAGSGSRSSAKSKS